MASYHVAAIDSIRARIASAWPEVVSNGIYLPIEMRNNLEAKVEKRQLPFAVLDVEFTEEGWAAHEQEDAGTVTIYYVVSDGTSPDTLIGKLETMRDAIYDTSPTDALILGNPLLQYGMSLPLNQYFFSARVALYAGAVVARVHITEPL